MTIIHELLIAILFLIVVDPKVVDGAAWQLLSNVGKAGATSNDDAQLNAIPKNTKLLILPGFGNDSSDYYLEQSPVGSLVGSLVERGWDPKTQIMVLPVKRIDWLQVFWKGVFDTKFWQGTAPPTRPAFRWYLDRVSTCIRELTRESIATTDGDVLQNVDLYSQDANVVLIGHSAGGWLGRAALGYGSIDNDDSNLSFRIDLNKVVGVVTLGAPNLPPPPSVMDMTRGALKLTSSNFPGAYHDELFYITVIGDAVKGIKQERKSLFEAASVHGFAYNSYEAVCGNGLEIGDGVVPIVSSHLKGALQINLKGIFHSINVPDRWYGSNPVIDSWHSEMLLALNRRSNERKRSSWRKNPFENIFGLQKTKVKDIVNK